MLPGHASREKVVYFLFQHIKLNTLLKINPERFWPVTPYQDLDVALCQVPDVF